MMMKFLSLFVVVTIALAAGVKAEDDDFCYNNVNAACNTKATDVTNCTAIYGGFNNVEVSLQKLFKINLKRSFDFLLMSTHYSNYEKNRVGFEKLFRGLSDTKWSDALNIVKYITKRGGSINVGINGVPKSENLELYELQAIAKALDMEKEIAQATFNVHAKAAQEKVEHHDPGVVTYLQEEFVERHEDSVRKLSGYASDLKKLLAGPDSSLSLFLFDEYLQKQ